MIHDAYKSALTDSVRESLLRGDVCNLKIATESMRPFLRAGDSVSVQHCAAHEIGCGDIIVFNNYGEICTHRCVCVVTEGDKSIYRTKGDATLQADDVFTYDAVLGKVVTITRAQRKVICVQPINYVIGKISYGVWRWYEYFRRIKRVVVQHV